jgi:hypothetical protein
LCLFCSMCFCCLLSFVSLEFQLFTTSFLRRF